MKLGILACAFGRHSRDAKAERKVHGQRFSRCRHCHTPMEIVGHEWKPILVHDAALNRRRLH